LYVGCIEQSFLDGGPISPWLSICAMTKALHEGD
jgi:hypothetical protein